MGSSPEEGLAEVRLRSPQMYDAVVEGAFGQMMAQAGLIHALGLDWRMWAPVLELLSPGRRVFAYDLRGHGWAARSPVPFTW
jgi:3-oxoadipate enol-lactonase